MKRCSKIKTLFRKKKQNKVKSFSLECGRWGNPHADNEIKQRET
jgi:hypothetical protein